MEIIRRDAIFRLTSDQRRDLPWPAVWGRAHPGRLDSLERFRPHQQPKAVIDLGRIEAMVAEGEDRSSAP
jgi:hypothetical protein